MKFGTNFNASKMLETTFLCEVDWNVKILQI